MRNQAITIQEWWERAPRSGQSRYGSLANLSVVTGLDEEALGYLFRTSVSTLDEWWKTIGKLIYEIQRKFANDLTLVARELTERIDFEIKVRTLNDHIAGRRDVRQGQLLYEEYYLALYAVTALPCFWLGKFTEIFAKTSGVAEERLRALERVTVFGEALLQELATVSRMNLTAAQKQRLNNVLDQISDQIENLQLTEEMNKLFS